MYACSEQGLCSTDVHMNTCQVWDQSACARGWKNGAGFEGRSQEIDAQMCGHLLARRMWLYTCAGVRLWGTSMHWFRGQGSGCAFAEFKGHNHCCSSMD